MCRDDSGSEAVAPIAIYFVRRWLQVGCTLHGFGDAAKIVHGAVVQRGGLIRALETRRTAFTPCEDKPHEGRAVKYFAKQREQFARMGTD